MYIFAFNINHHTNDETIILTENPTILTNESFGDIIYTIRQIIKTKFKNIAETYNVPLTELRLGVSTIYREDDFITMHSFTIDFRNIREVKHLIKNHKNLTT